MIVMVLQISVVCIGFPMQIRRNYINNENGETWLKLILVFLTFLTRMGQTYVDGAVYISVPDSIAVVMIGITIYQIWYPRNTLAKAVMWITYPLSKLVTTSKSIHKTVKIRSFLVDSLREYDAKNGTNYMTPNGCLEMIAIDKSSFFAIKTMHAGYLFKIVCKCESVENRNLDPDAKEEIFTAAKRLFNDIMPYLRDRILGLLDEGDKVVFEGFIGRDLVKNIEMN
jgi:hypothetical protein